MQHFPELDIQILHAIESHGDPARFVDFSGIEDYSADQIDYQVGLLHQRGLVDAVRSRTKNAPNSWSARSLTASGHAYLREQRASQSVDLVKETGNSAVPNNGGQPDETPTRFQKWKRKAEENRVTAALMLAFVIIVAFAGGWRQVKGEYLWTSIRNALMEEQQTYEDCTRAANDTFVEIMKCKEKFGLRP